MSVAPKLSIDPGELLEAFALPCALVDPDADRFVAANARFLRAFELDAAPETWSGFVGGFDWFGDRATEAQDATDAERIDEVFSPHTGQSYALLWSTPRRAAPAMVSVLNLTDMQELLRRQSVLHEQLLSTSRVLSVAEIVNTLAHELNQPLAAAGNYLDLANRLGSRDGSDRLVQSVQRAKDQVDHVSGVISRIREFVRTREPQRSPHDIGPLCQRVVRMLRPEATRNRVRVHLDIADELPLALLDPVMIEQVIANLCKNAIEAMSNTPPGERHLRVVVELDHERRIRVSVTDNGPGLTLEETQRLFTPLYSTKSRGMGIGLAISRSIIEFHDGTLFVEPGEQRGAIFRFTLPTTEQ